jgi:hypothetical protein
MEAPCRTFQHAHDVTNAGGEVMALDPAEYGPLKINKAISIVGFQGGIDASPDQIDINIVAGPRDTVVLRGLMLEGAGQSSIGIQWSSGFRLEVLDCVVRNFSNYGLNLRPGSTGVVSFLVANSVVSDNGQSGIYVNHNSTMLGSVNNSTVANNTIGINVSSGVNTEIQLSGDHIDNNVSAGGKGDNSSSGTISLILQNVTLNQTPIGVDLANNTNVWMSHVTQVAAPGMADSGSVLFEKYTHGSQAFSDGTNLLAGVGPAGAYLQVWQNQ